MPYFVFFFSIFAAKSLGITLKHIKAIEDGEKESWIDPKTICSPINEAYEESSNENLLIPDLRNISKKKFWGSKELIQWGSYGAMFHGSYQGNHVALKVIEVDPLYEFLHGNELYHSLKFSAEKSFETRWVGVPTFIDCFYGKNRLYEIFEPLTGKLSEIIKIYDLENLEQIQKLEIILQISNIFDFISSSRTEYHNVNIESFFFELRKPEQKKAAGGEAQADFRSDGKGKEFLVFLGDLGLFDFLDKVTTAKHQILLPPETQLGKHVPILSGSYDLAMVIWNLFDLEIGTNIRCFSKGQYTSDCHDKFLKTFTKRAGKISKERSASVSSEFNYTTNLGTILRAALSFRPEKRPKIKQLCDKFQNLWRKETQKGKIDALHLNKLFQRTFKRGVKNEDRITSLFKE